MKLEGRIDSLILQKDSENFLSPCMGAFRTIAGTCGSLWVSCTWNSLVCGVLIQSQDGTSTLQVRMDGTTGSTPLPCYRHAMPLRLDIAGKETPLQVKASTGTITFEALAYELE